MILGNLLVNVGRYRQTDINLANVLSMCCVITNLAKKWNQMNHIKGKYLMQCSC